MSGGPEISHDPLTLDERRELLARWAEAQRADGVAGSPHGSHAGEPCRRYALELETPDQWCARMVRSGMLLFELFPAPPSRRDLYEMGAAAYLRSWLTSHGCTLRAFGERGDLCFVVEAGVVHHVGVVVRGAVDGLFHTVDGNYDDRVMLTVRRSLDTQYQIVQLIEVLP